MRCGNKRIGFQSQELGHCEATGTGFAFNERDFSQSRSYFATP